MSSYCHVVMLGNFSRDLELRYSPKGAAVGNGCIAINRKWTSESGEKKEECSFVDICCFGKTAETIAQYCKKGNLILISGRLQQQTWDDKQSGQKRSKLIVVIETFQFMPNGKGDGTTAPRPTAKPAAPTGEEPQGDQDYQDNVPF